MSFTYNLLSFFHAHTNTPALYFSCWHLLDEWKAALAETKGVYPAHVRLLSFVHHKRIHVTRSLLFTYPAQAKRDVVCVLTYHTLNTQSSYICFIYCFVLLLYTNTKSTIAKFDLRALHILLIIHIFPISPLCWDSFIYYTFKTNISKWSLLWCTMWCSSSVAQSE